MSNCYGIDEECRIYSRIPCESPTLEMLCKTYLDASGNCITENTSNGVSTVITTTGSGITTIVQTVDTESTTTTLPDIRFTRMIFSGEGIEFDTDNYYNGVQMDELFVDIKELMAIIGAEVGIIGFLAIATELITAWLDDKTKFPNGLGVRAYIQAGDYGGEDPENRATYRPNRGVSISQQVNTIDGVKTVVLYFRMIKGDTGKPGQCRN